MKPEKQEEGREVGRSNSKTSVSITSVLSATDWSHALELGLLYSAAKPVEAN